MSYDKNSIEYSTTGFNFITDEELKRFVSVFGIFCLIGIRRLKPTLKTSPLVLNEK